MTSGTNVFSLFSKQRIASTRESADSVLVASSSVENAAVALRYEIEEFLRQVGDRATEVTSIGQAKAA